MMHPLAFVLAAMAALTGLSPSQAIANLYSYYNTSEEAFAACLKDGAMRRICPQNISNCWTHWTGNAGAGLQTWTSNEQNRGCGLSAGVTYHYHIFPTQAMSPGMVLVGPTSGDVVSEQSAVLAAENVKQLGGEGGTGDTCYGNPVDAAVGNKVQREVDFDGPPGVPSMARTYNSQSFTSSGYMGYNWTFDYSVRITPDGNGVQVRESSGRTVHCPDNLDGTFVCPVDVRFKLERDGLGYRRTWQDGSIERYNAPGNIIERFSPSGIRSRYDMVSNGLIMAEFGPGGHKLTPVWGAAILLEIRQPDGHRIRYQYDSRRRLVQVYFPDNSVRRYLYEDPLNPHALTGIIDETGKRVGTYAYDAATGQAVSTARPDGTESFGLGFSGAGATVTDAAGNAETLAFTRNLGVNLLAARTHSTDGKTRFRSFDANNNLVSEADEEGRTTTYAWDAVNRPIQKVDAAGTPEARTTAWAYLDDFLALPTVIEEPSVFGGAVKRTEIAYDERNRPVQIQVSGYTPAGTAVSRTVAMAYAPAGQIGSVTDANGRTTQFAYPQCTTGFGCEMLASITNPAGHVTTFDQYDANGRLLRKTDPNGLVTAYTYNLRGRILSVTETPVVGNARTYSYAWDAAGRLLSAILPGRGTLTYTYDAADRLASVTDSLGNKVSYAYDLKGNRTSDVTKDPGGIVVRQMDLAFNARNYPSQVNAAGSVTQLVHDAVGNLTQITDPNGNITQHQVDTLDRIVRTVDALGGMTDRGYDPGGNLAGVVTPNDAATGYEIDDLGNVLKEAGPDRGVITYTHDANGNRLIDSTGPYSYNPASNRMATGPPGSVTLDASGNTLSYAGQAYAYNQAGKLVSASAGVQTATYTYRHDGLRASKTVNGVTTWFHYDLDGRLIAETDDFDQAVREYVWDDSAPVAQIEAGVITYLHVDQLGTPRLGTNQAGAQVWAWDSDAFGTTQPTGTVTVNLRFPGQYYDAETGLHQNWNRTYDPASGRYLESDPIGLAGGVNTFGYALNNPLSFIDPDGRSPLLPLLGLGLIANEIATGDVPIIGGGVAKAGAQACGNAANKIGQIHHIATDKAIKSGYTERFENIFKRAGMKLSDPANKLFLGGHSGRHSPQYHRYIEQRLLDATRGLSGSNYERALRAELDLLKAELLKNPNMVKGIGIK